LDWFFNLFFYDFYLTWFLLIFVHWTFCNYFVNVKFIVVVDSFYFSPDAFNKNFNLIFNDIFLNNDFYKI